MTGLMTPTHMLLILGVMLLVFGPKRLPELGRSLGSGMHAFRRSLSGEDSPAGELPQAPDEDLAQK